MKQIRIKQVRSIIRRPALQKRTMYALGLRRMHQEKIVDASPAVLGMIDKVKHLLSIEEV
jgi:large subunit ribosomal protein L30